jgi:hypothetical protein
MSVNGLYDLGSPEAQARKQAARAAAEATATQAQAAKQAAKQAKQAAAAAQEKANASDPIAAMFGWSVPKNLGGIPTWMVMAGGLMAVMFVFKGGKK